MKLAKISFRRVSQSAFTLIELLVVISIIAMLVALLLPALAKARQSALRIKCATQIRTIGVGAMLYTNDNKGWALPYLQWGETWAFNGSPAKWVPYYFPIEGKESGNTIRPTFICPDADPLGRNAATYQFGRYSSGRLSTSYFFHFSTGTRDWSNAYSYYGNMMYFKSTATLPRVNVPRMQLFNSTDAAPWLSSARRPVYIPSPSEQPLARDAFVKGPNNLWRRGTGDSWLNNNHFRQGGQNIGYVDGHVIWQHEDAAIARHKDYYNTFYY